MASGRLLAPLLLLTLCAGALAQTTQPRRPTIAGQVRGADSKAAAGAEVIVRWRLHPELPGLLGRSLGKRGLGEQRHRADDKGRFKIRLPHRGPFQVLARKDGHSSLGTFPVMAGGYLALRLQPDHLMGGRVLTQAGKPVADADVILVPYSQTWARLALYRVPERCTTARTDKEGRFRLFFAHGYLRQPLWGDLMCLRVEGTGVGRLPQAVAQHVVRPTKASKNLRLEVSALPLLRGRLFDAKTRQPIVAARVQDAHLPDLPGHATVTDKDGRFTLPGTVDIELHVLGKDHVPQAVHRSLKNAKPTATLEAPLQPGLELRVQLQDGLGKPLSGARVLLAIPQGENPPVEWTQRLDAQGRLSVRALTRSSILLGFVEVDERFRRFFAAVGAGEDQDMGKITVRAGRLCHGKVLDAHRMPIAGARILLFSRDVMPGLMPRVTYTNRGGRFVFDDVADRNVTLVVGAGAHGQAKVDLEGDKLKVPVTVNLPAGKSISGRVLDPNGKPAPGAWVTLSKSGGISAYEAAGAATELTTLCVLADAEGRFRFRGLDEQTSWQVITTFIQDGVRYYGSTSTMAGKESLSLRASVSQD
ncbi:MAG: MSCRAMM family protein [Planctomycetota bacterium]|jgi:hypothetical protein